jgi:phage FluMu gp28-like protein
VTLETALDQGFLYKLQAVIAPDDPIVAMDEAEYFDFIKGGCASEEQFLQEYMCRPADDEGAFLTYDMIAGVEYRGEEKWEIDFGDLQKQHLYMGVDVGRTHDLTVVWILERVSGLLLTRKIIVMRNKSFSAQEAVIYDWLDRAQIKRACFDDTGLGMQLAERAVEKYGKYRVEPVRFSAPVKEELAYPVRAAFEDKSIRIPWDNEVRADLRSIRKTTTAAGNIRFEADTGPGGHADRFWALSLAVHAASKARTSVAEVLRGRFTGLASHFERRVA